MPAQFPACANDRNVYVSGGRPNRYPIRPRPFCFSYAQSLAASGFTYGPWALSSVSLTAAHEMFPAWPFQDAGGPCHAETSTPCIMTHMVTRWGQVITQRE